MRASIMGLLLVGLAGCGGTSPQDMAPAQVDMATAATPSLTVDNTLSWCTVTVTVGTAAPVTFTDPTRAFTATAGTTITLSASPNPGFTTVKWTGTTTMNGSMATYVMTGAATQSVTACCPFTNGTGC